MYYGQAREAVGTIAVLSCRGVYWSKNQRFSFRRRVTGQSCATFAPVPRALRDGQSDAYAICETGLILVINYAT